MFRFHSVCTRCMYALCSNAADDSCRAIVCIGFYYFLLLMLLLLLLFSVFFIIFVVVAVRAQACHGCACRESVAATNRTIRVNN